MTEEQFKDAVVRSVMRRGWHETARLLKVSVVTVDCITRGIHVPTGHGLDHS